MSRTSDYEAFTLPLDDLYSNLHTSEKGISFSDAEKRLIERGQNSLPEQKHAGIVKVFFLQFKSPIIYVLLIAAIVTFVIEEYLDGYFILAVLMLNAFIGTYQEYTAALKAESLRRVIKTTATVLRDGKRTSIDSTQIVPGDIVFLESGSKVPADIRLIQSAALSLNESLLTGESTSVEKDAGFMPETSDNINIPVAERRNMVYAGSYVESGRASGVVTATGIRTEIGKIALMLTGKDEGKAPLVIRTEKLSILLAKVVGIVVSLLIAVGYFKGLQLYDLFFFAVALAVSSIPEGLPVAITVALTSASIAMSKRNVIVRKLSAIEALGSCTFIASDKTGTLTKNQLSVEKFVPFHSVDDTHLMHMSHLGAILCNEVSIDLDGETVTFSGDQVDVALARHTITADEAYLLAAKEYAKTAEIPYEPQNRYAAIMVEKEGRRFGFVKGSPETILQFCEIDTHKRDEINAEVDTWAKKGYRTIALAYKMNIDDDDIVLQDYVYLGFMAIIDPIRDEAKEAVFKAKQAGIEVAMVTGDHPNTAFYIASQLGIADDPSQLMSGEMLSQWIEDGEDPEVLKEIRVFARVNPEQKQRIVNAFQQLGHYVAVTGDGVNDAPALRHANIGIAMGKSGTDIARSTSDLILTDDNFASIVNGIEEGRRAYDNIRKVVYLLVSTGFAEIVLVVLAFLAGMPLPLLPVQLLWLNLVTNGLQDVMLGLERAEPGLLNRKPRPPSERIFDRVMIRRTMVGGLYIALMTFTLFYMLLEWGYTTESARNLVVLLMVLFENVHVFNSRTEMNYLYRIQYRGSLYLIGWVVFTQLLHLWCMYNPLMQNVLSLEPVTFSIWLSLFAIAAGLIVVMEVEKRLRLGRRYFS